MPDACGAQDWYSYEDGSVHVYGTCELPGGHPGRYHRETRDGMLWASWSDPTSPHTHVNAPLAPSERV